MKYLLDTDAVSALMAGTPAVAQRLAQASRADVAISQVTAAEIEFGLHYLPASNRRRALASQWAAVAREIACLEWTDEVSRVFGERKARMQRRGTGISDFDLAIAAHAIASDLIVVTADAAFSRLDVRTENWLR